MKLWGCFLFLMTHNEISDPSTDTKNIIFTYILSFIFCAYKHPLIYSYLYINYLSVYIRGEGASYQCKWNIIIFPQHRIPLLYWHIVDRDQPKTSPFYTHHIIWVNYKVVNQLYQLIFFNFHQKIVYDTIQSLNCVVS